MSEDLKSQIINDLETYLFYPEAGKSTFDDLYSILTTIKDPLVFIGRYPVGTAVHLQRPREDKE
jgi:hypothetical protein